MHRESDREAENPGRRPPITHRSDRFRHGFSPLLKFLSPDASPLLTVERSLVGEESRDSVTSHERLGFVHSFPNRIGRTKANRWIDRRFISMEDFGSCRSDSRKSTFGLIEEEKSAGPRGGGQRLVSQKSSTRDTDRRFRGGGGG